MMLLRLRLRTKLFVAFALVLLPVLAVLWVDFRSSLIRQDKSILGDQLLTAQAIALQVDEAFDSLIGLGWAVSGDPVVRSGKQPALDARLAQLAEHLPHAELIAVYDEEGTNLGWAASGRSNDTRISIAERPEFRSVMATSIPQVSEVLMLERLALPGLVAMVPILDEHDRPNGVVAVGASTDQLARRYENARLLPGQNIFLSDRNGRLAFHTARRHLTFAESNGLAGSELLRRALAGIAVTDSRFVGLFGGERLAAFAPSHKYRWVVGVTVPRSVARAPIEEAFRVELAAFAGIIMASLVIAILLARYILQPVRRLEAAATALGQGDLSKRVRIESGDEIGRMGEAFNTMAAQLTRLDEDQREMLRLREDFMQAAAHELKTPLSTIASSLHLARGELSDAKNQRTLDIIGRQTRRMTLLVEDLLTVARLQGSPPDLRLRREDLAPLVEETARRMARELGHPIVVTSAGPLPSDVDVELIRLVLVRLLENAVGASPDGRPIEVAAERDNGEAVVRVTDHGRGVPPERQAHVFEPFYEAVPSGEPGYVGVVSLRLYVGKRILDAHGGRISLASSPSGGSTFSFALPLSSSAGTPEGS